MTICILFEDSRKKSGRAYEVLARKIVGEGRIVFRSPPRGDLLALHKVRAYLARLEGSHSPSKVIICVDSHSDPSGLQGSVSAVEKALVNTFVFAIKYVTVVHALESWLLEDGEAVRRVLGVGASNSKLRQIARACQPDRGLSRICAHFDKSRDDQKIAEAVDVSHLASCSPSFCQFVTALKDP